MGFTGLGDRISLQQPCQCLNNIEYFQVLQLLTFNHKQKTGNILKSLISLKNGP